MIEQRLTLIPLSIAILVGIAFMSSASEGDDQDAWAGYLDYAYVYSSADSRALKARLDEYGNEAGLTLQEYIDENLVTSKETQSEVLIRRRAIAQLLQYLASGDPDALEASVDGVYGLDHRLDRYENRYWYHYILAHSALERGRNNDFVAEVLRLWLRVSLPLETPYDSLASLSLSESPNSGFVAALPYVHENIARIVLIRSQEKGVIYGLDPLGAIVRMLGDQRIGMYADVIPASASSSDYVDRIVRRLDGPESDGGSLSFTLALFQAGRSHDRARSMLAGESITPETVEALRIAAASYESALNASETPQGQAAVYTRMLRLLGEVYMARQRLESEIDLETPFTIEGAMSTYGSLSDLGEEGWNSISGADGESYALVQRALWEEIQETCLNAADFYLSQVQSASVNSDEYARIAARIYSRYLSFFQTYTQGEHTVGVPDSAYFAAYEAARGFGDAFMLYSDKPSPTQVELATRRYRSALHLFPFDPRLWPQLTAALERHGREDEYMDLAAPVAGFVAGSRSIHGWVEQREPGWEEIETLRRGLADTQVIMLLGFGGLGGLPDLEGQLVSLRVQQKAVRAELEKFVNDREKRSSISPPASPDPDAMRVEEVLERPERQRLERRIQETTVALDRIGRQIETAELALPLYRATANIDDLTGRLRTQREHAVHTLLRRMYREAQDRS